MFSAYISMVMICLVLWNMNGFWLSIQLGISSSQLTKSIIFPRGRSTTNQWWFLHIYNFWWSSKWIDGGVRFRIYPHELVISESCPSIGLSQVINKWLVSSIQKKMFRDVNVYGLSRYHDFRYVMVKLWIYRCPIYFRTGYLNMFPYIYIDN